MVWDPRSRIQGSKKHRIQDTKSQIRYTVRNMTALEIDKTEDFTFRFRDALKAKISADPGQDNRLIL
jgi:hypothetical protein